FCLGIKKCSNAAFKFKMPNIPDFSIEVGLFGVQVLCYGALTKTELFNHKLKDHKLQKLEKQLLDLWSFWSGLLA
ncbi:hypothetical protein, partial [Enterococcus italicus]